jgi:hypothetical protein
MTPTERFIALFAGLRRAYGSYNIGNTRTAVGKLPGKAATVVEPLTDQLYVEHLTTGWTLGVVPIRDDGTCVFCALDIDVYKGLDHKKVVADIQRAQLPIVACRSKSGGMHMYVFFREPAQCSMVRKQLKEWSVALGFPSVEIFPKQDFIQGDEVGNWLNLPYAASLKEGGYGTERYGYTDAGEPIPELEAWLDYAESKKVSPEAFAKLEPQVRLQGDFSDGPPCIQQLAANKVGEGGRNNVLYQMAVYAKLKHGESFADMVTQYNVQYFDPPLSHGEVNTVIKSVARKDYWYKCKDQPCASVCKRSTCLTRPYGLGEGHSGGARLEYGSLSKQVVVDNSGAETQDVPTYYWTVNGVMIAFTMEELFNQDRFRRRIAEKLNTIPMPLRKNEWTELVNEKLSSLDIVQAPFEAGLYGQFVSVLYDFVREFSKAKRWDGLLTGLVYVSDESGQRRAYFRWQDLRDHMDRRKFSGLTNKEIWAAMRMYTDAQSGERKVKSISLRWWSVLVPDDLLTPVASSDVHDASDAHF